MVSDSSTQAADRASSKDVQGELAWLRQREGLSVLKIQRRCVALMGLPVTEVELRRRQLAATDRHVAAFEVLRCAVTHLVPRTDLARVLAATLNVGGKDGLLQDRREVVMDELFLTPKVYRRLEDEAYAHLAAQLVVADRSPCDGSNFDDWQEISFNVSITTTPTQLVHVLNLLTFERRETVRHALSQVLLDGLPNARAALESDVIASLEGPWALARRVIGAILIKDWPPRMNLTSGDTLMLAESMSTLLLSQIDPDRTASAVANEERDRRLTDTDDLVDDGGPPTSSFNRLKARGLLALAAEVERNEIDNRWQELLSGDTASRVDALLI